MANLDSVHDKLCWTSFEDVNDAAAELRSVLPAALVERLDWSTLAALPERFVDDSMRGSHADRLYEARYGDADGDADNKALVYVLWEHKSEVDKWTLLQLLRYMVRIWEHCLTQSPAPSTLPPIIPLVIHHSESGWTATTSFHGLFEPTMLTDAAIRRLVPDFEIVIDDISHRTDAELRGRGMSPRAAPNNPNGRRALEQLFVYTLRVASNLLRPELQEKVRQVVPEAEELVMTAAEQLIQEGIQQGISQGIQQGISQGQSQGKREMVRRQLALKFGELPRDTVALLDSADDSALDRYAERLLTATSLSEVLGN